jgi:cysteine-rich repeat protein
MRRVHYVIPSVGLILSACPAAPALCGDGLLQEGEACDDGNAINSDGCDSACVEATACGDGITFNQAGGTEQCDDANADNNDGCDSACQLDPVIRSFEITTRRDIPLLEGSNICVASGGYGCYGTCTRLFNATLSIDEALKVSGLYNRDDTLCNPANYNRSDSLSIYGDAEVVTPRVRYTITVTEGNNNLSLDCTMNGSTFDLTCDDQAGASWVLTAR